MMTAGPAPLTPVPMVVKIPPPIIVPKPMAIRSLAVRTRRKILRALKARSFSTSVVAKRRCRKDITRAIRRNSHASPFQGQPAWATKRARMSTYQRMRHHEIYRNPWISAEVHEIVHPTGVAGEHLLVVPPRASGVVIMDGDAC